MYNDVKKLISYCEQLLLLLLLILALFFSPISYAQEITVEGENTEMADPDQGFLQNIINKGTKVYQDVSALIKDRLEQFDKKKKSGFGSSGPLRIDDPEYLELGTFVVNLKGGKYFLKTTISLIFIDKNAVTWLNPRVSIVNDLIITQLRRLTPRNIRKKRVRQLLRNDLKIKINSLFPNNWPDQKPLKKILFPEFYTQ